MGEDWKGLERTGDEWKGNSYGELCFNTKLSNKGEDWTGRDGIGREWNGGERIGKATKV